MTSKCHQKTPTDSVCGACCLGFFTAETSLSRASYPGSHAPCARHPTATRQAGSAVPSGALQNNGKKNYSPSFQERHNVTPITPLHCNTKDGMMPKANNHHDTAERTTALAWLGSAYFSAAFS